MTQLALSRKARINATRISFIENGHVEATPDERDRLARSLKVAQSEIFPVREAVAS